MSANSPSLLSPGPTPFHAMYSASRALRFWALARSPAFAPMDAAVKVDGAMAARQKGR